MTLQVPFDAFPQTVGRALGIHEAYVARRGGCTLVTAGGLPNRPVVAAIAPLGLDATKAKLREAKFEVYEGAWLTEGLADLDSTPEAWVVGVAYESDDGKPGLWMDGFPEMPTQVQALRAFYEEFQATGEAPEVSFDDFVRLSNPTVVVVSPQDVRSYLAEKATASRSTCSD